MALPHGAVGWYAVCDFVFAKLLLKWMGNNVQDLSLVLNELCVPVLIAGKIHISLSHGSLLSLPYSLHLPHMPLSTHQSKIKIKSGIFIRTHYPFSVYDCSTFIISLECFLGI